VPDWSDELTTAGVPGMPVVRSQPWIHRFTFERKDAEYALVYATKRLTARKPRQRLDPQTEFPQGKTAFCGEAALAQPLAGVTVSRLMPTRFRKVMFISL
jgi:hypothetical protein